MAIDQTFFAPSEVTVFEVPPEQMASKPSLYHLRPAHFIQPTSSPPNRRLKKGSVPEPYLILGFDTEFKTPDIDIQREDIRAGKAKYEVLSYQFHAITENGNSCSGICCPKDGERVSLGEFLTFALGRCISSEKINALPRSIYLVGHFTRADMPAFSDFEDYTRIISAVRNTFISIDNHIKVRIPLDKEDIDLRVFLRDTMLLTPGSSRSLSALGAILERPKIKLHDDPKIEQEMKRNMDLVRRDHWDLFRDYALNDAIICAEYLQKISAQNEQATGKKKVPVTLTSIGVELLQQSWRETLQIDPLKILGQETYSKETWNKRKNRFIREKKTVSLEQCFWHESFVTETYHGGRNEQFWFGPCYEANWIDYDLSSAYPTAMALIGLPDWEKIYVTREISDFTATTLGYACVDFKFPENTKYPSLPVRTNNGLIFPLEGRSYCGAPEIQLAKQLGAELKILHGVIVPSNSDIKIFGDFIKDCIKKRNSFPKKSLDALFWKEISNSTYGKTAQGLREKRVYDMRERKMGRLPKSKITNPFYASFITSFVRAVLGEIINSLPDNILVFSCTTDGFITDADDNHMLSIESGSLASIFKNSRQWLTGVPSVLEKKHEIKLPLGWRTRGQATLISGALNIDDPTYHVVLARGGITIWPEISDQELRSQFICEKFFSRTPTSENYGQTLTGIRDIIEFDADLVPINVKRRLSMEFDWKRRPRTSSHHPKYHGHLIFSTKPWTSFNQFQKTREQWVEFQKKNPLCLKTVDDLDQFSRYLQSVTSLRTNDAKYLASKDPDLKRLRQTLCSAWHCREAGLPGPMGSRSNRRKKNFIATAEDFARLLSKCGISTKQSDVQNAKKKTFLPNKCPATPKAIAAVDKLQKIYPSLRAEEIFSARPEAIILNPTPSDDCYFINLVHLQNNLKTHSV